jgi:hypothetical protein
VGPGAASRFAAGPGISAPTDHDDEDETTIDISSDDDEEEAGGLEPPSPALTAGDMNGGPYGGAGLTAGTTTGVRGPTPPYTGPDVGAAGTGRRGVSKVKAAAMVFVALLLGAGGVMAYLAVCGVNPLRPRELSETKARLADAEQQLKTFKLQSLLHRWAQEPGNRQKVEAEIEALSPRNVNLRYLKLVTDGGKSDPARWKKDAEDLAKDYPASQKGDGSIPGGDPRAALFSQQDLAQLQLYGNSARKAP